MAAKKKYGPPMTHTEDGKELIFKLNAAKILGVTQNSITKFVRDGKLTSVEGSPRVIKDEVVELAEQRRSGSTGGADSESAAERLAGAQLKRKRADVLKYHSKLRTALAGLVVTDDVLASTGEVLESIKSNLANWSPPFLAHLSSMGEEAFADEVEELNSEIDRLLRSVLPVPQEPLARTDRDVLLAGEPPIHSKKIVDLKTSLELIKTQLTMLEYREEIGQLAQRREVKFAIESGCVALRSQINNLRGRLLDHLSVENRMTIRQDLIDFNATVQESAVEMADDETVKAAVKSGLEPPENLTVSEAAEKYRVLTSVSSNITGKFRVSITPYLREIMDVCGDDETRRVTLQMPAQSGKTEVLNNVLLHKALLRPSSILYIQPTLDMCKTVSADRVNPMIEASPELKAVFDDAESYAGGAVQKALSKHFKGGVLNFAGSNSAASLASRPCATILADETDRWALSAGKEGSPLELAIKRTASFVGTSKVIITSTPTIGGVSVVERSYLSGDRRVYLVPCPDPDCGEPQELLVENIHFEKDDPKTAMYCCQHCGTLWNDAQRKKAVGKGVWVATNPNADGTHKNYKMSGVVSPFYTHEQIVTELLASKGDPLLEQVFVNTVKGEAFRSDELNLEPSSIVARMNAEDFSLEKIPTEVLMLVGSADVQKDRIELTICGYSETQCWMLSHQIISGDPTGSKLWEDFSEAIFKTWRHPLGGKMRLDAVAVDSGNWTTIVEEYCATYAKRGVMAIKGASSADAPVWRRSKTKKAKGFALHLVGVHQAKATIMQLLQAKPNQVGYIHFANLGEYGLTYAEQLLNEYRDVQMSRTGVKVTWVKKTPSARVEALDCMVYNYAIRQSLKPDWTRRLEKLNTNENAEHNKGGFQWAAMPS